MKNLLAQVTAFHIACDVPVIEKPQFPSQERMDLRDDLLAEEYNEYCDAMVARDLPGVADALGDMAYIIAGTALEFGIPLDRVLDAIHAANMSKVDGTTGKVRRRDDGKILKPEGFTPPDIAAVLAQVA